MNLLIITQKVDRNDPVLGFFHEWIARFSKHWDQITVICLEEGDHLFPKNVEVFSLGKEKGISRTRELALFYRYIFKKRESYDVVFTHMNPIYVLLGGLFWKAWKKKIFLWYTHKHVDSKLRAAMPFVDGVFTASKESFRLKNKKVIIVGHGIDTDIFSPPALSLRQSHADPYVVLSVARISKTKNQLVMIKAFEILRDKGFFGRLVIVGDVITKADESYRKDIIDYIRSARLEDVISWTGPVSPRDIIQTYWRGDMLVNLSTTGSVDKAVLEAMACGLQVLTSNEAFLNIVPAENITSADPASVAIAIERLAGFIVDPSLRRYVVEHANLDRLVSSMSDHMKKV